MLIKLRSIGAALAAIAALASISTAAADGVSSRPLGWTGFYVGANGGYGWANRTVDFTPLDINAQAGTCGGAFGGTCAPPASSDIDGGLGGVQVGYNWQWDRTWLIGVEADFDWSRIEGTATSDFILGSSTPAPSSFEATEYLRSFGTVRARLGFVAAKNLLLFGTGGFAFGKVRENVVLNSQAGATLFTPPIGYRCLTGPNCFVGSSSGTRTGWTAGGGAEYALSRNVSIKTEYLYVDLGRGDGTIVVAQAAPFPTATPSSFAAKFDRLDFHVIRAGINFRFDGP